MEKLKLDISEECYEEIVRIIEEISGKEKAAAFRVLTQRQKAVKENPTDKRAKARLENAEIKAGLSNPTVFKKYKMSDKPRTIG